jgi:tetratricopeptide (TPR) repeat protein
MDTYVVSTENAFDVFEDAAGSAFFFAYPYKLIVEFFGDEESLDEYGKITGFDFSYNILAMKVAWGQEDFDEIEYYYQKGLGDSPNLPALYMTAGDIYFLSGDCESAVEKYEILESLVPDYEKDSEEYRLFIKHASAFGWAMDNLGVCRGIISED